MKNTWHTKTLRLCIGALLLASGVLLPQVFHMIGGQAMGGVFLPMHIPVFLAGLLLGPFYGGAVGVITPLISTFITSMPPFAKLPFMVVELLTYGVVSGLLRSKRINIYISLVIAQITGRIANALALVCATYIFHLNVPAAVTVGTSALTGIPGLVVQLILIPAIVLILERMLHLGRNFADM